MAGKPAAGELASLWQRRVPAPDGCRLHQPKNGFSYPERHPILGVFYSHASRLRSDLIVTELVNHADTSIIEPLNALEFEPEARASGLETVLFLHRRSMEKPGGEARRRVLRNETCRGSNAADQLDVLALLFLECGDFVEVMEKARALPVRGGEVI